MEDKKEKEKKSNIVRTVYAMRDWFTGEMRMIKKGKQKSDRGTETTEDESLTEKLEYTNLLWTGGKRERKRKGKGRKRKRWKGNKEKEPNCTGKTVVTDPTN